MKKLLVLLLTFCLLTASAAWADTASELSALSNDDLITLLFQVQQEIVARRIRKTAHMTNGDYVGGVDIPAGKYCLTSNGITDDHYGIVSLRSVNDPAESRPTKLYEYCSTEEPISVFITVEEGDTLHLPFPFNITIHAGLFFE